MDTTALITYLDSHSAEYEEWYELSKDKYLRVAQSLLSSLSNCNITVLDSSKFSSFLRVVKLFLNKKEIFEDWKNVRSLIEFILLNLGVKNEGENKYFILQLLMLLTDILERTKPIHSKNLLDKKRILEATSFLLNNDVEIAVLLLKLINVVLKMEGVLRYNFCNSFEIIMNLLLSKGDAQHLCLLANIVFERPSIVNEKIINPILQWVFKDSVSYLKKENVELERKKEIFSLILDLNSGEITDLREKYPQFSNEYRKFMLELMKISDVLWLLCKKNHAISDVAQEVFNKTVLQFLKEENMLNCDEETVIKDMRLFYVDSHDEQGFPKKYFFFICHMQEMHSRLCWFPKVILKGIEDWFYNKRRSVDTPIFKSILFLYPRLALNFCEPKYIACSSDILQMTLTYGPQSEVLTFCKIQLVWILKMGFHSLKKEALRYWIDEKKYHKTLMDVIVACHSERILLNLIVEESDRETGRIASKFLQKIGNEFLSQEIAKMLPFATKQPNVFNCLIASRPGVPERVEERMLLLELMSIMIPSLAEDSVLRSACLYINDLLESMKKEPNCLSAFCKYTTTVQFLIYASYRTQEDVSKEILFLFRNLASIQAKYQFELECVDTDPKLLLNGSTRQINRVLTVIPIILCAKVDPLLNIKDSKVLTLFYQISDFVVDVSTQENALKCLHLLIKKYDWLSFSASVGSLIKFWCSKQFDGLKAHLYMIFIILWLKKLIKYPGFLRPEVPSSEIQNFFMRSGDINQTRCCSRFLRILQGDNSASIASIRSEGSWKRL